MDESTPLKFWPIPRFLPLNPPERNDAALKQHDAKALFLNGMTAFFKTFILSIQAT